MESTYLYLSQCPLLHLGLLLLLLEVVESNGALFRKASHVYIRYP